MLRQRLGELSRGTDAAVDDELLPLRRPLRVADAGPGQMDDGVGLSQARQVEPLAVPRDAADGVALRLERGHEGGGDETVRTADQNAHPRSLAAWPDGGQVSGT